MHTLCIRTLRSDCQGLTLIPPLTLTVDTTYCDVVLVACLKPCQLTLCNTGIADIQESSIWRLGIIGSDIDEVEISTTQSPVHSDIHRSIDILREVNTGESGERGGT